MGGRVSLRTERGAGTAITLHFPVGSDRIAGFFKL